MDESTFYCMLEMFTICGVVIFLCAWPFWLLASAFISTFKSKHVWCISMYVTILVYTIWVWLLSPRVYGWPHLFYWWWYTIPLYGIMVAAPLLVQLKALDKKPRVTIMWVATVLVLLLAVGSLMHNVLY